MRPLAYTKKILSELRANIYEASDGDGLGKRQGLSGFEQVGQGERFGNKLAALLSQGYELISLATRPKVLSHLLKGSAETASTGKRAEAQHRVIALLDAAMILLDSTILVGTTAMFYLRSQYLIDSARIGSVPVGGDLDRIFLNDGESTAEEALRGGHVSGGTEQGIDQIACAINSAVQIAPFAFHL